MSWGGFCGTLSVKDDGRRGDYVRVGSLLVVDARCYVALTLCCCSWLSCMVEAMQILARHF